MADTQKAVPGFEPFPYDDTIAARLTLAPDGSVIDTRVDQRGRIPVHLPCEPVGGVYRYVVLFRSC